jgi:hypothetical protein
MRPRSSSSGNSTRSSPERAHDVKRRAAVWEAWRDSRTEGTRWRDAGERRILRSVSLMPLMHTIAEAAASSLPPPLNPSRLLGKRGSKVSSTSLSLPPVEHQQLHGLVFVGGEEPSEEWIQMVAAGAGNDGGGRRSGRREEMRGLTDRDRRSSPLLIPGASLFRGKSYLSLIAAPIRDAA